MAARESSARLSFPGVALTGIGVADTDLSDLELDITMAETAPGIVLVLLALVLAAWWRITTPAFAPSPATVRSLGTRTI